MEVRPNGFQNLSSSSGSLPWPPSLSCLTSALMTHSHPNPSSTSLEREKRAVRHERERHDASETQEGMSRGWLNQEFSKDRILNLPENNCHPRLPPLASFGRYDHMT